MDNGRLDNLSYKSTDSARLGPASSILPITAEDLKFRAAEKELIQIANLCIQSGGPSIILGPNGAGKSLLLRLLHGLLPATDGDIKFNGKAIDRTVQLKQAMVFQKPVVLRRTVAANVHYALKVQGYNRAERSKRVTHMLSQANLSAKAAQSARSLSGGEQQLLALARALVVGPEVLFLDEPTSSLDPTATQKIETLIRSAATNGTKIIMVSHDLGQAKRLGQEILFCHDGQISEQTPAERFFSRPTSTAAQMFLAGGLLV